MDARRIRVDTSKTSHNIEKAYNNKKYIVTYDKVYQPHYSQAQGQFYMFPVYELPYKPNVKQGNLPLIGRGRFVHYTGDQVNKLIRIDLLNNL